MNTKRKYKCPVCGTHQIKQATNDLIIRVECYKCGSIQTLTNILGSK